MQTRVHISLEVASIPNAISFYSQLFGTAPTKVRDGYANFRLEQPALHLALVERPDRPQELPVGESSRHFGVELFEDAHLTAWQARAEAAALPLLVEQQVTCCYAVANKFWAIDPDGHRWEFWVRTAEADSMLGETSEACCAKPDDTVSAVAAEPSTKASPCCGPSDTLVNVSLGSRKPENKAPCCG